MGAPMYGRFPSEKEREREAREYGRVDTLSRTEKIKSSYGELAMSDILPATDPVPVFATPELPRLRGYGGFGAQDDSLGILVVVWLGGGIGGPYLFIESGSDMGSGG